MREVNNNCRYIILCVHLRVRACAADAQARWFGSCVLAGLCACVTLAQRTVRVDVCLFFVNFLCVCVWLRTAAYITRLVGRMRCSGARFQLIRPGRQRRRRTSDIERRSDGIRDAGFARPVVRTHARAPAHANPPLPIMPQSNRTPTNWNGTITGISIEPLFSERNFCCRCERCAHAGRSGPQHTEPHFIGPVVAELPTPSERQSVTYCPAYHRSSFANGKLPSDKY